ncbi:MAG: hypothetical protein WC061_01900 [Melioribacteraceae bacterium]
MHLSRRIKTSVFLFSIFIGLLACSEKEKSDKYVVKVNESALTEAQIQSALNDEVNRGKTRAEFINNWIEREILYQEAVNEGILNETEYKSLIENSKKELAAALFINKLLVEDKSDPAVDDIKKYFESNSDEFRLIDDAFRINIAYFGDFEKAVKFRDGAILSSWKNSLNMSRSDTTGISSENALVLYKYQIQPASLLRIISDLGKDEISVVLETGPSKFVVVQLVEKFFKDTVPPFELLKDEVNSRLTVIKKKELIKKYIDKLVADHNLEIKRYSE